MSGGSKEQKQNKFAEEFQILKELGVRAKINRRSGELVVDLMELAKALGLSLGELLQIAIEGGLAADIQWPSPDDVVERQ